MGRPKSPSTNDWIKKKNCRLSIQWNLFSHKKNEVLIPATRWMNLENNMLSDTKGWRLYDSIYRNVQHRSIYRGRK